MGRVSVYLCCLIFLSAVIGCGSKEASMSKDMQLQSEKGVVMAMRRQLNELPQEAGDPEHNREAYDKIVENEFLNALQNPKSTFSIDVDTASYSNVRRMLNNGEKPVAGAVRIEELVNYFPYDYPSPTGEHPFSVTTEVAQCPWNKEHQLVRIGLKGLEIEQKERPASNLVFLLDVSGSMQNPDKLPLVKSAMRLLVENLNARDRVAIVVYASASGLVLPSTSANEKAKILAAIDGLNAGGSTNGGKGIELAYGVAESYFIDGGTNRVILCTDGDFNVGVSSQSALVDLITQKAKSNIFLSVFGFGTGNLNDSTMERLSGKGNGNYGYIDSLLEARKSLVQQMGSTLITIAKDVKIQVDFNPARVDSYRLIGYENRLLANQDFDDDSKDAGEIGAGHTVTALYEIVPAGSSSEAKTDSPSKFVESKIKEGVDPKTMLIVNLRYKKPTGKESKLFSVELKHDVEDSAPIASSEMQFASAVAAFGMKLRGSKFARDASWDWIVSTAEKTSGDDPNGFRNEFVGLAKRARMICKEN